MFRKKETVWLREYFWEFWVPKKEYYVYFRQSVLKGLTHYEYIEKEWFDKLDEATQTQVLLKVSAQAWFKTGEEV